MQCTMLKIRKYKAVSYIQMQWKMRCWFICYPPPSLIVAVISLSTAFGGIDFLGLIVCNMVITREMWS